MKTEQDQLFFCVYKQLFMPFLCVCAVFYRSNHGECCQRTAGCKNVQLFAQTQQKLVKWVPMFRQLSFPPAVLLTSRTSTRFTLRLEQEEPEGGHTSDFSSRGCMTLKGNRVLNLEMFQQWRKRDFFSLKCGNLMLFTRCLNGNRRILDSWSDWKSIFKTSISLLGAFHLHFPILSDIL